MSWSIDFAPQIPWPLFWAVAGLALLLGLIVLLRARPGALLRAGVLAALVAALANPTLKQEEREPLSNIAVVVVDKSPSQRIDSRDRRTERMRALLEKRLAAIKGLEVRILEAAGGPDDDGTRLFAALESALATIPSNRLAGVIMLTDGQVHDVPKSPAALGIGAPVHVLLSGRKGEFDRRIKVLRAPRYGIVGSRREAEIVVEQSGRAPRAGRAVTLRIRRQGKPDKRIATRIGERVRVPIDFPHAGNNIVEIELEAHPGELTKSNNRVVLAAEGVRENLRVLLVSGEPHAGERTWRNLLKSDAAVDLVHFTILRPPEKQDGTPIHQLSLIAFPTRELFSEKLNDFDLIIFDRYRRRGVLPILYLDNISRYVEERGGAVLVAAGKEYANQLSLYRTPLSHILPAVPTGRLIERPYKPRITEAGRRHPVTRGLPGASTKNPAWGRWFRLIEAEAESGEVLMQGPDNRPLLVLDRRGKGRVALLLSDHAWLWARGYEGGGPYNPLLRRLAHWLMKEPDLEEEFLSAKAKGLAVTIERRSMKETVDPVTLTEPDGSKREVLLEQVAPGLWRKTITVGAPGLVRVQSGKLTALANAGASNALEMREVVATEKLLRPVLEATGGGAFWTVGGAARGSDATAAQGEAATPIRMPRISLLRSAKILHGSGWLGLKDRGAYVTRGIRLIPLFTGFVALAVLLALLSLTWWREGR